MILLCLMVTLLTACQPPSTTSTAAPTLATTNTVAIPTLTASASPTIAPSKTEAPTAVASVAETQTPAATETPAPTRTPVELPRTPLPTFDKAKARRVPTQVAAVCPKEDPTVVDNFKEHESIGRSEIMDYLNVGGSLKVFDEKPYLLNSAAIADLTGDGVSEIIWASLGGLYNVIWCKGGKYELSPFYFDDEAWDSASLREIRDLNQNGVPEMFLMHITRHGNGLVYIYEWDGSTTFRSLIHYQGEYKLSSIRNWVGTVSQYDIKDINGDGLQEIILVDDRLLHDWEMYPAYNETIILGWDGEYYVNMTPGNFTPGKFRFQATEMGDMETLYGNYDQAFAFYRAAIFDEKLAWWSPERVSYERDMSYNSTAALPTPIPDLDEYPRLAAYAYYRMMILHVYLSQIDAAKADYAALKEKFPVDSPGYPYVEMASSFLQIYQETGRILKACGAASAYADAHSEMLAPLGGAQIHGWASHTYDASDICPFYMGQ